MLDEQEMTEQPRIADVVPLYQDPDEDVRLFVDVAGMLAHGLPEPLMPTVMRREDGVALFYPSKVSVVFGDPESGKSWLAYAAVVETVNGGGSAAIIDTDHNGAAEIVNRLITLGVDQRRLIDPDLFKLAEPEDGQHLLAVVDELRQWRPDVVVVDSIGEVLPLLGCNSNSPDEYSAAHRAVLSALAQSGAAVIAIDHMPKGREARAHGQTGTLAKRRAVNGVLLQVTVAEAFAPGRGGAASLTIYKDRPGGLRAHCPVDGKTQPAGRFVMTPQPDGGVTWRVTVPTLTEPGPDRGTDALDVAELDVMDPPPESQRDVMNRMGWGSHRAMRALRAWRTAHEEDDDQGA